MNLKRLSIVSLLAFVSLSCDSGDDGELSLEWQRLVSAPLAADVKHDDLSFVSETEGWFVTRTGEVYHTQDGGTTFDRQLDTDAYFRTVGFANPLHGWVGNLRGEGSDVLYETFDGGENWRIVDLPKGPQGLCGIHVFNESVVNAVGRLRGPPFFLRTEDAGVTWTATDLSLQAAFLIDVYFFTEDVGIIVGGNGVLSESSAIILKTRDGGETWSKVHETSRVGEWCWKISFVNSSLGFVSVQTGLNSTVSDEYYLKTVDGGDTW